MNNINSGYNCTNSANNVTIEPIIDKINEVSYIKKYYNPFDTKVSDFINSDLLEQEVEQTSQQRLTTVKYDDPFRNARMTAIENQNEEECDALEALKKKERTSKKRKLTRDVETKLVGRYFQKYKD